MNSASYQTQGHPDMFHSCASFGHLCLSKTRSKSSELTSLLAFFFFSYFLIILMPASSIMITLTRIPEIGESCFPRLSSHLAEK